MASGDPEKCPVNETICRTMVRGDAWSWIAKYWSVSFGKQSENTRLKEEGGWLLLPSMSVESFFRLEKLTNMTTNLTIIGDYLLHYIFK